MRSALASARVYGLCPSVPSCATFPGCVAYGFMPARAFDLFEAAPLVHGADERVPVEDLGMAARFFAELAPAILGS